MKLIRQVSENDLLQIIDAIQPIITKVLPTEPFDLDHTKGDINDILEKDIEFLKIERDQFI